MSGSHCRLSPAPAGHFVHFLGRIQQNKITLLLQLTNPVPATDQQQCVAFFKAGVTKPRGLGLSQTRVDEQPQFVVKLEPEANRVVVGPEGCLYQDSMWASRVNYVLGQPPAQPVNVAVKIRYKSDDAQAVLHPGKDGALIRFDRPQRAITPGQAAVFYQGDVLIGGGIIESEIPQNQVL